VVSLLPSVLCLLGVVRYWFAHPLRSYGTSPSNHEVFRPAGHLLFWRIIRSQAFAHFREHLGVLSRVGNRLFRLTPDMPPGNVGSPDPATCSPSSTFHEVCSPYSAIAEKVHFSNSHGSMNGANRCWVSKSNTFPSSGFLALVTAFSLHCLSACFIRLALLGFHPSELFPSTQHSRIAFGMLPSCRSDSSNCSVEYAAFKAFIRAKIRWSPAASPQHWWTPMLSWSFASSGYLQTRPLSRLRERSSPLSRPTRSLRFRRFCRLGFPGFLVCPYRSKTIPNS